MNSQHDNAVNSPEQNTSDARPCCAQSGGSRPGGSGKTKHREHDERHALINRLSRIEGQVRGVQRMVEADAYCVEIATQVMAIASALNAFNRELMAAHIKTCVSNGVRAGDEGVVDELIATLQKLMR